MKLARLLALVVLVATPAAAQWQVPNGAVPLGRGAGVTGFSSVLGSAGAGAQCLIDTTPPTFAACPPGTGAALTKTDDTNVTLTLGGAPATSLLRAASLTLGWNGTLSTARGGLGQNASAQTGIALNTAGTFTWLASSGTGNVARVTSPVFVTPDLGTPSAVNLANGTNLPIANTTGTLAVNRGGTGATSLGSTINNTGSTLNCTTGTTGQLGCLRPDGTTITVSGGVITSVGSAATSISVGTTTIVGGSSGQALFNNGGVLGSRSVVPTVQRFTSGSGTYTTPANVLYIRLRMIGGGGSGSNLTTNGGDGGNTCWNTTGAACTSPVLQAGGGAAGVSPATTGFGGAGGTISGSSTCSIWSVAGGKGGGKTSVLGSPGGDGGNGFAGGGPGVTRNDSAINSPANTGAGGQGVADTGSGGGSGGGAGAYCETLIASPAATYTYAIGAGGTAPLNAGGGGSGYLVVEEYYN